MKKEFVLIGVLALILIGVGFVASSGTKINDAGIYKMSVNINEGWNLIEGFYPDEAKYSSESEISKVDIDAAFMYSPDLNKYIEIYPNMKVEEAGLERTTEYYDDEAGAYAYWIHSKKSGVLIYETQIINPNNVLIKSGWNFIGINPEMKGKRFEDIKGTCNILKMCGYQRNNWECVDGVSGGADTDSDIGIGMVVKVSNQCTLSIEANTINPPQIPN